MSDKKLKEGEFYNEALGCRFTLPHPFTVRHHERWVVAREEAEDAGAKSALAVNWIAAVAIIDEWECDTLQDLSVDPYEISGPQIAVIAWVGTAVLNRVLGLFEIPKN